MALLNDSRSNTPLVNPNRSRDTNNTDSNSKSLKKPTTPTYSPRSSVNNNSNQFNEFLDTLNFSGYPSKDPLSTDQHDKNSKAIFFTLSNLTRNNQSIEVQQQQQPNLCQNFKQVSSASSSCNSDKPVNATSTTTMTNSNGSSLNFSNLNKYATNTRPYQSAHFNPPPSGAGGLPNNNYNFLNSNAHTTHYARTTEQNRLTSSNEHTSLSSINKGKPEPNTFE